MPGALVYCTVIVIGSVRTTFACPATATDAVTITVYDPTGVPATGSAALPPDPPPLQAIIINAKNKPANSAATTRIGCLLLESIPTSITQTSSISARPTSLAPHSSNRGDSRSRLAPGTTTAPRAIVVITT